MARVEEVGNQEDTIREAVRDETRRASRMEIRRPRLGGCCGCFLLSLLVAFFFFSFILYIVAQTGLVEIPVFSRFYNEPQPERLVRPSEEPISASLERQIMPQLAGRATGRASSDVISIRFTEEELTRFARDFAASQPDLRMTNPEIMIFENELRFFSRVELGGTQPTTVRMRIRPKMENNNFTFEIAKLEIGEMPIWHRLVNSLAHLFIDPQIAAIRERAGADLDKINNLQMITRGGELELRGEVSDEVLRGLISD